MLAEGTPESAPGKGGDDGPVTVVAACQLRPRLGDPAANRERAADAIGDAAARGAEIVVLPELMSSGYVFEDTAEALASAEAPTGETVGLWSVLAREHDLVLVGGFCERAGDVVHNSAAVVDASGVRAVYRKAHLWDRERLIFTPGDQAPPIVETRLGRLSTVICYDLEFPEWVRIPALAGAQLLVAPVNWPANPGPEGERPVEVVRAQADAGLNRMPVVACDRVGEERGVGWVGGSVITDADGWVLAGGWSSDDEQILLADVDLTTASDKHVGEMSDVHGDRRADLYPTDGWPVPTHLRL
jgi:predicted amidohydrolase